MEVPKQLLTKNPTRLQFILKRNMMFLKQRKKQTDAFLLEGSDPNSLVLYVSHSLMRTSGGMKELDGYTFGVKAPEGLQPKGFESVLHTIPGLTGCCILYEADLDCFDEGHPLSHKR